MPKVQTAANDSPRKNSGWQNSMGVPVQIEREAVVLLQYDRSVSSSTDAGRRAALASQGVPAPPRVIKAFTCYCRSKQHTRPQALLEFSAAIREAKQLRASGDPSTLQEPDLNIFKEAAGRRALGAGSYPLSMERPEEDQQKFVAPSGYQDGGSSERALERVREYFRYRKRDSGSY